MATAVKDSYERPPEGYGKLPEAMPADAAAPPLCRLAFAAGIPSAIEGDQEQMESSK
jgi:hypothetical protein